MASLMCHLRHTLITLYQIHVEKFRFDQMCKGACPLSHLNPMLYMNVRRGKIRANLAVSYVAIRIPMFG